MKKITKAIIAVTAVACLATTVFAQNKKKGPDFENTLSTDIVNLYPNANWATFAGIYNETKVELFSSKVDAEIDVKFGLENVLTTDEKERVLYLGMPSKADKNNTTPTASFELIHWYIEFRPIERLTLGLNPEIFTHGSYLPIANKNVGTGNIGSNIDVVFRPIDGLRLAAGVDMLSWFGKNTAKNSSFPLLNFGADYTYGSIFSIGVSARNVINSFAFGIYGEYSGIKNLNITAGYSYNDRNNVCEILGTNRSIINAGATYSINKFSFGADFLTNFGADYSYDLYTAGKVSYQFTKEFSAEATVKTFIDFAGSNDKGYRQSQFIIAPAIKYAIPNNEIGAGVTITLKDNTILNFPIYWKVFF